MLFHLFRGTELNLRSFDGFVRSFKVKVLLPLLSVLNSSSSDIVGGIEGVSLI